MYTYVYTYVYTCIYIYIYIYTYTYHSIVYDIIGRWTPPRSTPVSTALSCPVPEVSEILILTLILIQILILILILELLMLLMLLMLLIPLIIPLTVLYVDWPQGGGTTGVGPFGAGASWPLNRISANGADMKDPLDALLGDWFMGDLGGHEDASIRKGGWYGWEPSSSSNLSIRAFRACPLIEIRRTAPCRAIRGNSISVNSTLPPS